MLSSFIISLKSKFVYPAVIKAVNYKLIEQTFYES